jgi:hypothetical protein
METEVSKTLNLNYELMQLVVWETVVTAKHLYLHYNNYK